jgi:hypothetical protein
MHNIPLSAAERLTRSQAADLLGVCQGTLCRWEREGLCGVHLTVLHVGGRVYYTEEQLRTFLAEVDRRKAPPALAELPSLTGPVSKSNQQALERWRRNRERRRSRRPPAVGSEAEASVPAPGATPGRISGPLARRGAQPGRAAPARRRGGRGGGVPARPVAAGPVGGRPPRPCASRCAGLGSSVPGMPAGFSSR